VSQRSLQNSSLESSCVVFALIANYGTSKLLKFLLKNHKFLVVTLLSQMSDVCQTARIKFYSKKVYTLEAQCNTRIRVASTVHFFPQSINASSARFWGSTAAISLNINTALRNGDRWRSLLCRNWMCVRYLHEFVLQRFTVHTHAWSHGILCNRRTPLCQPQVANL